MGEQDLWLPVPRAPGGSGVTRKRIHRSCPYSFLRSLLLHSEDCRACHLKVWPAEFHRYDSFEHVMLIFIDLGGTFGTYLVLCCNSKPFKSCGKCRQKRGSRTKEEEVPISNHLSTHRREIFELQTRTLHRQGLLFSTIVPCKWSAWMICLMPITPPFFSGSCYWTIRSYSSETAMQKNGTHWTPGLH